MWLIIALALIVAYNAYQWYTMSSLKKTIIKTVIYTGIKHCINSFVPNRLLTYCKGEDNAVRIGGCLKIKVRYESETGYVYVPYNDELIPRSVSNNLFLSRGGVEEDINQLPGVPFMITANILGVKEIIKIDEIGDRTSYTWSEPIII